MSYAPTLTAYTDAAPCPRIEVLFTSFATGTVQVDVYRLAAGRQFLMRGGVKSDVSGALTRIDFEIPFGVPVGYRAEMFDAAGLSLGFTDSTSITLDVKETWVHNPLDPQGATTVGFQSGAARSVSRPFEGDVVWPIGRTVGVVVSGQRRGIQDVVLDIIVFSYAQADKIQAMFGGYDARTVPVICVRIGADDRARLPRPLFAGVLKLTEDNMTYRFGDEVVGFSMTGSEVAPPTPAIIIPLLTRADLNAAFPTRAAFNAFFLTRLDANRAYQFAGTA